MTEATRPTDARRLLAELRRLGITLTTNPDGQLEYKAPRGALSPALRTALRENLDELKVLLAAEKLGRRPAGARVPASYAQARFWILSELDRDGSFNLSVTRDVGDVAVDLVERSVAELVGRHEILRTRLVSDGGVEPRPVTTDEPIVLERRVAAGGTLAEKRSAAARIVRDEARRRLDATTGPVFRAVLVVVDEHAEQTLLLVAHHAVFDGRSRELLARELDVVLDAFRAGRPSPLPELPLQYADYAAFERAWVASVACERELEHWKGELAGTSQLELPLDRPRPPFKGGRSAVAPCVFSADLSAQVVRFAALNRTTVATVLLAAYYVVLARWSRQDDIVVGTIVDGRNRPELLPLVGPLVNLLALRTTLSATVTFDDLVAKVQKTWLGARTHQQVPFERVVESLELPRDPSRTPLFQVAFNYFEADATSVVPEAKADAEKTSDAERGRWGFDLYWMVGRGADGGFSGSLEFDTDLFDRATVERLLEHCITVLGRGLEEPTAPVCALPLHDAAEHHRLIRAWNRTAAPFPRERCLHELFEERASETPNGEAVVFEGASWAYAELDRRANRLARWLRDAGVGPGSFVAVYMERSLEMVASLLAILKAGAAYVPIDPDYPRDRVEHMLADAGAGVILTQAPLAPALGGHGRCLAVDRAWETLPADDTRLERAATPNDLAYMIFTSGSTGRPKGAMNAHVGIVNRLWWMQEQYRLGPSDRVLQKTPFSFDVSVWEFFWPLLAGATLVVARAGGHRDPAYIAETIARHAITTVHFVPSMLRIFLTEPRSATCTSLVRVICSGEALTPDLVEAFTRVSSAELHNLYGPTEAAVDVTSWRCERGQPTVPIGSPIANVAMYVLDRSMEPLPMGLRGELYIGGVAVGRGYHARPALTAERFVPDPFSDEPGARLYRTGDVARRRADGALEYLGRDDGQVKVRGHRIELGEIEAAIRAEENIADTVVVVRKDDAQEARLVAYVVATPGATLSRDVLRSALARRLPESMLPSLYVLLDALPLGPSGKVDRRALPAPDLAAPAREYVAPRTPMEEAVVEVWQSVLGVGRVGVHDDFIDLGGHSLQVMKVAIRLREVLEREVSARTVFTSPTVEELARRLSETDGPAPPPIARTSHRDGDVLSYCQDVFAAFERDRGPSATWTMPFRLRLRGALDRAALQKAIELLVTRQESLRVALDFRAPSAAPRLCDPAEFALHVVDMRGRTDGEIASYCFERASSALTGRLVHFDLLERATDDHVLLVLYHQFVHDPTSGRLLLEELRELYASIVDKRETHLAPLPLRYVDYAVWQKRWYEEVAGRAEVDAAKRRIAKARPLALPTDRPRSARLSTACTASDFALDAAASRRFLDMCDTAPATVFMGFGVAAAIFFARWAGQEDLSFLAPVNQRGQLPAMERVFGRFVNMTAVTLSVAGDPTILELFRRVRAASLAAHAEAMVPAPLVFDTPLVYDHPLLRVTLNVLEVGARPPPRPAGGTPSALRFESEAVAIPSGSRNEVAIVIGTRGDLVTGTLHCASDLFDATTVRRKACELVATFEALELGRRLSELHIPAEGQR